MGMTRKEITFDLSQEALRKHYPRKKTAQDPQFFKRAYKDIRRFMEANGFEGRRPWWVWAKPNIYSFLTASTILPVSA